MASLFDSTINANAFAKLQSMKESLIKEKEVQEQKYQTYKEQVYKERHIFHSYEECLDWMKENPYSMVHWHCSDIMFDDCKNLYKAYEQEFSYDGVMCYDVINYYTKEDLLKRIEKHKERIKSKYPDDKEWWLDEYGTLKYVNI